MRACVRACAYAARALAHARAGGGVACVLARAIVCPHACASVWGVRAAACAYVCLRPHARTYAYAYACACVRVRVAMRVCLCFKLYWYVYLCMCVFVRAHVCVRAHRLHIAYSSAVGFAVCDACV